MQSTGRSNPRKTAPCSPHQTRRSGGVSCGSLPSRRPARPRVLSRASPARSRPGSHGSPAISEPNPRPPRGLPLSRCLRSWSFSFLFVRCHFTYSLYVEFRNVDIQRSTGGVEYVTSRPPRFIHPSEWKVPPVSGSAAVIHFQGVGDGLFQCHGPHLGPCLRPCRLMEPEACRCKVGFHLGARVRILGITPVCRVRAGPLILSYCRVLRPCERSSDALDVTHFTPGVLRA